MCESIVYFKNGNDRTALIFAPNLFAPNSSMEQKSKITNLKTSKFAQIGLPRKFTLAKNTTFKRNMVKLCIKIDPYIPYFTKREVFKTHFSIFITKLVSTVNDTVTPSIVRFHVRKYNMYRRQAKYGQIMYQNRSIIPYFTKR